MGCSIYCEHYKLKVNSKYILHSHVSLTSIIKENSAQVLSKLRGQCLLSNPNNWPDYL